MKLQASFRPVVIAAIATCGIVARIARASDSKICASQPHRTVVPCGQLAPGLSGARTFACEAARAHRQFVHQRAWGKHGCFNFCNETSGSRRDPGGCASGVARIGLRLYCRPATGLHGRCLPIVQFGNSGRRPRQDVHGPAAGGIERRLPGLLPRSGGRARKADGCQGGEGQEVASLPPPGGIRRLDERQGGSARRGSHAISAVRFLGPCRPFEAGARGMTQIPPLSLFVGFATFDSKFFFHESAS